MTDEEMQQARRLIEARASGDLTGGAWIETVHEMAKLLLPALDEIEKLSAQLCAARGEAQRRHQEQDVLMTIAEARERDIARYRTGVERLRIALRAACSLATTHRAEDREEIRQLAKLAELAEEFK